MSARLSAFAIWALIAATAVFWALRLVVHAPAAPAHAVAVGDALVGRGDLSRLLGAPAAPAEPLAAQAPEAISRFRLLGIVASRSGRAGAHGGGVALIAVDGKPARAYSVGSHLDADLVLQAVSLRTASIGPAQGAQGLVLEIPRLPPATTGTLPPIGAPMPVPLPAVAPPPPIGAPAALAQPPIIAPATPPPPGPGSNQRDGGAQTQ
ncbi:MAG TPA: type II secretion system protein N [Caldimonas sp.]